MLTVEIGDRGFCLDDVALDRRARDVRAPHGLVEEGRVVLLGAVEVRRGLEHELAHRALRAAASRQDVHRPDDVVLVCLAWGGRGRVHHQAGVDHRVDLGRLHHPAQQRVLGPDLHILGPLELDARLLVVDADDRLDRGIGFERLGQPSPPVGREPRYEDALGVVHRPATRTRSTCGSATCRTGSPGCGPGLRWRRSARAPCPRACPSPRRGWARGSGA
jgi:hypothetical protein